ncbi:MAG: hypothetical protein JSS69_16795 [Acidobacteria bacterium]|nr:hypothetical protein [Acidobacteriota bacterium]MBS1867573.1 hypothetical protein [Acidobacteriota bacterium]
MRRLLIFALALSLAGLGAMPLSECAFLTSKLAECATPQTQSQCDNMNMNQDDAPVLKASQTSCCILSGAPIPQSQHKTFELSAELATVGLDQPIDSPRMQPPLPFSVVQNPSPPSLQSLHCTFLI